MRSPNPRRALRVGITGHRLNRLAPENRAGLAETLARTLRAIDGAARSRKERLRSPGPPVRLLSPLAEGADRIAAQAAPPGWALAVVLPMPRADYERDFLAAGEHDGPSLREFRELLLRAGSVTELPAIGGQHASEGPERSLQYGLLGPFLVGEADLLVAVWNGRPAEGPGGTATVVREALERGVGVVWIDPAAPGRARILDGFAASGDVSGPLVRELDGPSLWALIEAGPGAAPPAQPAASASGAEAGSAPATIAEARAVM